MFSSKLGTMSIALVTTVLLGSSCRHPDEPTPLAPASPGRGVVAGASNTPDPDDTDTGEPVGPVATPTSGTELGVPLGGGPVVAANASAAQQVGGAPGIGGFPSPPGPGPSPGGNPSGGMGPSTPRPTIGL